MPLTPAFSDKKGQMLHFSHMYASGIGINFVYLQKIV